MPNFPNIMYHSQLERQIKKYLDQSVLQDEGIKNLLAAISQSYNNYERDRELSEHAFAISEREYRNVNDQLKKITEELENIVNQRTKEITDIAQFPLENPNPIFRVTLDGEIAFINPAAEKIKTIEYLEKKYSVKDFFSKLLQQ